MTTYRYQGLSASGTRIEGVVEAFDQQEAVTLARENCHVVLEVAPEKGSGVSGVLNADIGELLGGAKIKEKDLSLLCSQLSIELKAGLPLVRSLRLVAENEENKTLRRILEQVSEDVQAGHGLAESLATRGPSLPSTFIETVRAGEASGRLDDSFARLKAYYENAHAVRSKVGSAMVYPIMLIVVAVIVVGIIMIKAVPVFEESFASMGNELPAVTQALISVSNFMTEYYLLFIAIIAAIGLAVKLYGRTEAGRALYARIALTFPGIGLVNQMNAASEFSSTMSTMLASGLPIVQATQITGNVASNYLISKDIEAAAAGVITGQRLGDCLAESKWLPKLLLEMTSVGEETGSLEETLDVVSGYYTEEVKTAVNRALSILEPCIVMVLASLVVFILLAVYMPMFSMYGSV